MEKDLPKNREERMAKLFQSAMKASPAKFVPVSSSARSSQKSSRFSKLGDDINSNFAPSIPTSKTKTHVGPLINRHYDANRRGEVMANFQEMNIQLASGNSNQALTLREQRLPEQRAVKPLNWPPATKTSPLNVHTSEEHESSDPADIRLRIQLRESDFLDTKSIYPHTSEESIESGEITNDSPNRSEPLQSTTLTLKTVLEEKSYQAIQSFTNFTASSALHSTAIDQSLTQSSSVIDPNKTFLTKNIGENKVESNTLGHVNLTFAPFRENAKNSVVKKKDSGYSTSVENTLAHHREKHLNEQMKTKVKVEEDPNKTFKPAVTSKNSDDNRALHYDATFVSCTDCYDNIASNFESLSTDPNMTFTPKRSNENKGIEFNKSSSSEKSDGWEKITNVRNSTDCCNMTVDDHLKIIHSPTTHKIDLNAINLVYGKENIEPISDKMKNLKSSNIGCQELKRMKVLKEIIPLDSTLKKQANEPISQKRPRIQNKLTECLDTSSSKQKAKKHRILEPDENLDREAIHIPNQQQVTPLSYPPDKETKRVNHAFDENLDEEIRNKIEEMERKERCEKWGTVKALLDAICNPCLPNSVKITALEGVIDLINKNNIPMIQILHEEKDLIEKVGKLLENDRLEVYRLVLHFLKVCIKSEALEHLPFETKKQILNVLQQILKCNETEMQINAKSIFYYLNSHM